MSELNDNDYVKILKFYKKSIPHSKRLLKLASEKILAEKLCRCIKKLDPGNEARSIGICTKSIFNNKHLTRGKFKCKGKQSVTFRKTKMGRKTRKNNI